MSHSPDTDAQGGSEATLGSYSVGFILAIILTAIPFAVVGFGLLPRPEALITVGVTAVIQILVHLYFFLHLDVSREHLANTMTGVFTALIMAVLVGGTIWLFYSLNYRTMMGGG
ncbi:cytochrome o ubiquinol oxidase subunit IV [Salinisphaera sp. USBA-960]|uniref:cytochrome o ubiquinol oxidase subunit IV n=1 Tax=Salinisphaera orenii TaxID=856731 RepID=UPI000DBE4460|nr:cytochrome o ubiquinol oxidase subunit IV [Salifodinibacter halophilus]NNC27084.1 cytochrome o ubiquinol oxidase subunit IV [Salifodinibacter halophilus]